jgi:hypothetical protein
MFATTPHRRALWSNLEETIRKMMRHGLTGTLFLDGSYVTDKEFPSDIEVAFDVRSERDDQKLAAILFQANHFADLKKIGIDWYPTLPDASNFILFFQYIKEKDIIEKGLRQGESKGLLEVVSWQIAE